MHVEAYAIMLRPHKLRLGTAIQNTNNPEIDLVKTTTLPGSSPPHCLHRGTGEETQSVPPFFFSYPFFLRLHFILWAVVVLRVAMIMTMN